jgi:hypothetical protein
VDEKVTRLYFSRCGLGAFQLIALPNVCSGST